MFNAKQFKKRQKQVWDAVADVYDQSFSTLGYPAAMQMILEARLQAGDVVLDLASGTGMDAFTAAPFVGDDGKIVGVDISERMVAVANDKVRARGIKNCEFQVMDAEDLKFKNATFDAALCKWGLMYFPDCHRALKETLRVLKPGGRLTALVLGRQESSKFLVVAPLAAYKVNPTLIDAEDGPSAFQFGPEGALEALLNAADLVNVRTRRFALMITCADGPTYWDLLMNGAGNFADRIRRAEHGVFELVRRTAIESVEKYNSPEGIRLPFEVVLGYAEKEAKGREVVNVPARIKSLDELAVDDTVRMIQAEHVAKVLRDDEVALVDVRPRHDHATSRIPRAHNAPRGKLEELAGGMLVPEALRQIVVYGATTAMGRLGAQTLAAMGYQGVVCLDGGFDRWTELGLPVDDRPISIRDPSAIGAARSGDRGPASM